MAETQNVVLKPLTFESMAQRFIDEDLGLWDLWNNTLDKYVKFNDSISPVIKNTWIVDSRHNVTVSTS